jgi:hypothetical protein
MDGIMHGGPGESSADLIKKLRGWYVTTPRDRAILDHLGRVLQQDPDGRLLLQPTRFGPGRETRGVMVVAPSGEGKSSLIGRALSGFHQTGHEGIEDPAHGGFNAAEPGMLALVTPSPGTMKALGCALLGKLGYTDVSERRERWSIWKLVHHRLALNGVRLVWLDEAQHILAEGSVAERSTALNAIKTLMAGPNACTVILAGDEDLEGVRAIDPQIERRFTLFRLAPMTGPKERRKLAAILSDFCGVAGLGSPIEPQIIDRILHGVGGRFGRAIEVMIEAIVLALRQNSAALDCQHFAESWAITTGCAPSHNVFIAEHWADIPPIGDEADDQAERKSKKGRRKAK